MENTLKFDDTAIELNSYLKSSGAERLKKGFELTEWAIKLNKNHKLLLKQRLADHFLLQ